MAHALVLARRHARMRPHLAPKRRHESVDTAPEGAQRMLPKVSGNSVWHACLAVGGRVAWMFTPRNRQFGYPRGQVATAAYRPRTARAADLPTTRLASHLHRRGLARPSARNNCGEKAADRLRLSRGRLPPEQTSPPAGRRWPGRHAGAPRLRMIVLAGRKKSQTAHRTTKWCTPVRCLLLTR